MVRFTEENPSPKTVWTPHLWYVSSPLVHAPSFSLFEETGTDQTSPTFWGLQNWFGRGWHPGCSIVRFPCQNGTICSPPPCDFPTNFEYPQMWVWPQVPLGGLSPHSLVPRTPTGLGRPFLEHRKKEPGGGICGRGTGGWGRKGNDLREGYSSCNAGLQRTQTRIWGLSNILFLLRARMGLTKAIQFCDTIQSGRGLVVKRLEVLSKVL